MLALTQPHNRLDQLAMCRHTLGEFRRTHEEAGLAEARRLLTAEQWDAIQDVSSPASYFV